MNEWMKCVNINLYIANIININNTIQGINIYG